MRTRSTADALAERPDGADRGQPVQATVAALAVGLAYYVGARIGWAFQAESSPQSVLWLPNSILLAALLVTHPRNWWICIAASFPAQLISGSQSGAPLVTISLLFVTNCTDALLGATLLRRPGWAPFRFDGLTSTFRFFVLGAILSPVIVSFPDAAITVWTEWGTDYWSAVVTRVRANVLTNVILVPAIVTLVHLEWRRVPRSMARAVEAGVLVAGVGLIAVLLGSPATWPSWGAEGSRGFTELLIVSLPFLVWAALRFGPGLTAACLVVVAFVASWNATQLAPDGVARSPDEAIDAVQLFLLAIATTVLSLAAAVQDLRRTATALGASYERIRDLAGRLLTTQETERKRIARELHDDINQRLAAMAISLTSLRILAGDRSPEMRDGLLRLQEMAVGVSTDVRELSHELHSSVLQHAGLVAALRSVCQEVSRIHGIDVAFRGPEVETLPDDVSLCLYRVGQEALRNVIQHASASRATIALERRPGAVHLIVADDGQGFDPAEARRRGGLGLISIEERVRMAAGTMTVDTAPKRGTQLRVLVPLEAHNGTDDRPPRR